VGGAPVPLRRGRARGLGGGAHRRAQPRAGGAALSDQRHRRQGRRVAAAPQTGHGRGEAKAAGAVVAEGGPGGAVDAAVVIPGPGDTFEERLMASVIRNRIKGHRRVRAGDLVPHEWNYRLHPDGQKDALRALYQDVGFARSLLAYELPDGRLKLIDG